MFVATTKLYCTVLKCTTHCTALSFVVELIEPHLSDESIILSTSVLQTVRFPPVSRWSVEGHQVLPTMKSISVKSKLNTLIEAQTVLGVLYNDKLEKSCNIAIPWNAVPIQTPRCHQMSNRHHLASAVVCYSVNFYLYEQFSFWKYIRHFCCVFVLYLEPNMINWKCGDTLMFIWARAFRG